MPQQHWWNAVRKIGSWAEWPWTRFVMLNYQRVPVEHMILFAVCVLLPDIARGFRRALKFTHIFTSCGCTVYDPVYPRCVIVFSCANALCHWVQHLAVGMYILLPALCHCILLFESPKIHTLFTIEIYYSVRAKNPVNSTSSEHVPAKCVLMVFWHFLYIFWLTCHGMPDLTRLSCAYGTFDFRRAYFTQHPNLQVLVKNLVLNL